MQPSGGLGPMLHASGIIRAVNLEGPGPGKLDTVVTQQLGLGIFPRGPAS